MLTNLNRIIPSLVVALLYGCSESPQTEEHEAHLFTVQHKGYINADAVLDWIYAHFFTPVEIFVTGSSAGSIPSPYYAMRIAGKYPDARIAKSSRPWARSE